MIVIFGDREFNFPQAGPFVIFRLREHIETLIDLPAECQVIVDGQLSNENGGADPHSTVEFFSKYMTPRTLARSKYAKYRSIDD